MGELVPPSARSGRRSPATTCDRSASASPASGWRGSPPTGRTWWWRRPSRPPGRCRPSSRGRRPGRTGTGTTATASGCSTATTDVRGCSRSSTGRPAEVVVPGSPGAASTELIVSRDGTGWWPSCGPARRTGRLGAGPARLRRGRARASPGRRRCRSRGGQRADPGHRLAVADDGLGAEGLITDGLSQVRTVSVDGAPGEISTAARRPARRIRTLVSSPVDLVEAYAVAGRSVVALTGPSARCPTCRPGSTSLTYVG